jgi:hypothetical protein
MIHGPCGVCGDVGGTVGGAEPCTEPSGTTNPAARTVDTAKTTGIKKVVFFIVTKKDMKVCN